MSPPPGRGGGDILTGCLPIPHCFPTTYIPLPSMSSSALVFALLWRALTALLPRSFCSASSISVSGPGGVRPRVFSNYWAENKSVRIQEVILPHLSYPPQLWNRTKWQEESISTGRQRGQESHDSCKTTSSEAGSESLSGLPLGSE